MQSIIKKAIESHSLNKSELIELLSTNNWNENLFSAANFIREKFVGNEVYLRALIEISNICQNNCKYCGLRRDNKTIERYKLGEAEIIECAKNAVSLGFKTIVLQSGENQVLNIDELCYLIKKLKEFNIAITLSLGEKTYEEYKALKKAGANRYLLRIETTDKKLYGIMHPDMDYKNRLQCLYNLKSLGYELGTGSLVGLPNQTISSIAEDILFFKEIDADMIGIGPLITHPQTPLKDYPNGDFLTALKVMALTRLLLPNINIPATTAMETIQKNGQITALQCGANVVMPNATNDLYIPKYEIYPSKANAINIKTNLADLTCKFNAIGRTIKMSQGNSLNWINKNKNKKEG